MAVLPVTGVRAASIRPRSAQIAWEQSGPLLRRLWGTARASATDPELVFGKLADGPVLKACGFAVLVELVALGSLALVLGLVASALAPDLAIRVAQLLVGNQALLGVFCGLVPALALLMVLLHAAWAVALELSVWWVGSQWKPKSGLRFAFYSCGWDLMTSPAGLLLGSASAGPIRGWRDALAAAKVPRQAMALYLGQARALSPAERVRARRMVFLIMAVPVLAGIFALAWLVAGAVWRAASIF